MENVTAEWDAVVGSLEAWMTPSWLKNAREHGDQPWIRLVLLVDAHDVLTKPAATEKIAMTMADLASGRDEGQRAGWEAIADHAKGERMTVVSGIVDRAPSLLSPELMVFFERSVEPTSHFMP